MQNFSILYNDIPRRSALFTTGFENLFFGGKNLYWESAAPATATNITFDMGAGNTASARYFAASGVNAQIALTPGTLTYQLRASTDNFSGSDVLILEKSTVITSNLIGTYNEEIIASQAALSVAYRYWRFRITTSNSVIHKLRKVYFGDYFDFNGRSPRYPYSSNPNTNAAAKGFMSDAGVTFKSSSGRPVNNLKLNWWGISDATKEEYFSKVGNYLSDYPVYLYEPDGFDHKVLRNKIMFGWLVTEINSNNRWKNANEITASFVEDILG